MASTKCWHCHELAQMVNPVAQSSGLPIISEGGYPVAFPDSRFVRHDESSPFDQLYVYSCVNCGYPNIAEVSVTPEEARQGYFPDEHIARWLPIEPLGKDYPHAPAAIASLASEVHKCLEVGAVRAAMILARSVLEGIVADQEGEPSNKKLYERIENLKRMGIITSRTADAATAIRLCGNDYVHNVLEPADVEYVEIVIQILDSMIDDLYSNPSLVAQAKAYAERRKESQRGARHGTD